MIFHHSPNGSVTKGILTILFFFLIAGAAGYLSYPYLAKIINPSKPPSTPAQVGLEVGNSAPEIEGADIGGNNFKLSDYHGKVVMLDFWGNW